MSCSWCKILCARARSTITCTMCSIEHVRVASAARSLSGGSPGMVVMAFQPLRAGENCETGRSLPHLFISHSCKDDLAAEAMRRHLVERGWNHKEIFLDLSVEGIAAHEKWKVSL